MDKIIKQKIKKNLKTYIKKYKNPKKIIYTYTKLFLESGFELDFFKKKN
jgi:hypothetical protein